MNMPRKETLHKRIPLPQKEFNKLKKNVEDVVVSCGGEFVDKKAKSKIDSTYALGDKSIRYYWHFTYSQSSINKTKDTMRKLLNDLCVYEYMNLPPLQKGMALNKEQSRKLNRLRKKVPNSDIQIDFKHSRLKKLVKSIEEVMSKSAAEYQADILNENPDWDRMIRYYY